MAGSAVCRLFFCCFSAAAVLLQAGWVPDAASTTSLWVSSLWCPPERQFFNPVRILCRCRCEPLPLPTSIITASNDVPIGESPSFRLDEHACHTFGSCVRAPPPPLPTHPPTPTHNHQTRVYTHTATSLYTWPPCPACSIQVTPPCPELHR